MTEEEALQRLRAQDTAVLHWLIGQYNRYVASIIRAVLGKTCREEDAEELTADVFYSVFRRAGSISPGKLQAYLGAAARNRAKDFLRKQKPLEADLDELTTPGWRRNGPGGRASAPRAPNARQRSHFLDGACRPGNFPALLLLFAARTRDCGGDAPYPRCGAHPTLARPGGAQKTTFTGGIIMRVKLTDLLDDLELDPGAFAASRGEAAHPRAHRAARSAKAWNLTPPRPLRRKNAAGRRHCRAVEPCGGGGRARASGDSPAPISA